MDRRDIDGEHKRLRFEIADRSYIEQVRKLQRLYERDKVKLQTLLLQGYTISRIAKEEEL
jgi:hypothetical protein